MPEDNTQSTGLTISEETQTKFGDLIAMIQKSESMNDEERQYWVDALPVMTEDQITNLRDILENEQGQLNQAEQNLAQANSDAASKAKAAFDEEAYRAKKQMRLEAERQEEEEESKAEENILAELENL